MMLNELPTRPELVGAVVIIERYDAGTGLYGVRLHEEGVPSEMLIVRQVNLTAAPDGPSPFAQARAAQAAADAHAASTQSSGADQASAASGAPPGSSAARSWRAGGSGGGGRPPASSRAAVEFDQAATPGTSRGDGATAGTSRLRSSRSARSAREMHNVKVGVRCRPLSRHEIGAISAS